MIWVVVAVVAALAVFAIAAGTIGRETHRLATTPPAPSFDLTHAVLWISGRLPDAVTAQLSYADVRDIVTWHLESLDEAGLEQVIGGSEQLIVVDEATTVEALVARALSEGKDFTSEQVQSVLTTELGYLAAIGAVGPIAEPDDDLT